MKINEEIDDLAGNLSKASGYEAPVTTDELLSLVKSYDADSLKEIAKTMNPVESALLKSILDKESEILSDEEREEKKAKLKGDPEETVRHQGNKSPDGEIVGQVIKGDDVPKELDAEGKPKKKLKIKEMKMDGIPLEKAMDSDAMFNMVKTMQEHGYRDTYILEKFQQKGMCPDHVNKLIERAKKEPKEEKSDKKEGDSKVKKSEEYLEYQALKKSGEGSRGGKILGHTKSGKPIYDQHDHPEHASFGRADHKDAMRLNDKMFNQTGETRGGVFRPKEGKEEEYGKHQENSFGHEESARTTGKAGKDFEPEKVETKAGEHKSHSSHAKMRSWSQGYHDNMSSQHFGHSESERKAGNNESADKHEKIAQMHGLHSSSQSDENMVSGPYNKMHSSEDKKGIRARKKEKLDEAKSMHKEINSKMKKSEEYQESQEWSKKLLMKSCEPKDIPTENQAEVMEIVKGFAATLPKQVQWEDENKLLKANTLGRNHTFRVEQFFDEVEKINLAKAESLKKSEGQDEEEETSPQAPRNTSDFLEKGMDASHSEMTEYINNKNNELKKGKFSVSSFSEDDMDALFDDETSNIPGKKA